MTPYPRLKQKFPTLARTLMSLSGKVKTRTPAHTIGACMRGNARLGRLLAALPALSTVGAFRKRGAVAMACLQRFQLISLSALLCAALALVTPSDKAFGQTTTIDLDILNIFYDPVSKDLIIVFNEGIDLGSVELSRFRFPGANLPNGTIYSTQPLTSFTHDVNGNTLTVSLSSAVSDRLDEAIGDSAITIPNLVSDADAVNATAERGGEPLEFSGFAGDVLTILTAGAVPPPVVDSGIDLDSSSQPRTLTVSGNGITGQTIELFDRGTSVGTGTVDSNGLWRIIVDLARTTDFVTHVFTATATDSDSNTSALSGSQSIGVNGEMNSSPTVHADFDAADVNGGLNLLLRLDSPSITLDLSNLYTDPDGDPLTIEFDNLNSGLITTSGSRITFGSAAQGDFSPNDMITFDVIVFDGLVHVLNDNGGNQLPFTVRINPASTGPVLSASNVDQTLFETLISLTNPPTTSGLMVTLNEDTPHTFAAGQFNFNDVDGDDLHSLRIDTLPATGRLTLSGAAVTAMQVILAADIPNLVYTPVATGTVTFTYSLSDGTAFSASTATATLTITDVEARITDLNEEVLPEVARIMANLSVEGITHRIDQVRSGTGRSVTLAGQNRLAAAVSAHGQAMADGTLGMKDMLGNSAFVLPLNATDGASGIGSSLTFWGGGNYRDFEGSGGGIDFDGDLFSAQLGVDGKPRDDLLIGLAASWSESDIDYRGDAPNLRGEHQLEITSLHPYASWEARDGLDLWVTAGYGQGDLEISNNRQNPVSSDVEAWTLGAGGNYQLPGTTTFRLKGSALLTELEVKGGNGIAAMEVDASQLQIVLEKSHKYLLSNGAYMEPSLEAGARYDSGGRRREAGLGAELGAGLRYANPAIGLTLEGRARTLVGRDDYEEWGVSGRILLQPGSNGRGLLFSLSPVYGSADSGTQALWQEGLRAGKNRVARGNSMRMESRLGYGLGAPGGHGLLTPYAEITSGESTQRYRLGMNWEVGPLFDLNLVGERSESTDTDHAILLKGVIRY